MMSAAASGLFSQSLQIYRLTVQVCGHIEQVVLLQYAFKHVALDILASDSVADPQSLKRDAVMIS